MLKKIIGSYHRNIINRSEFFKTVLNLSIGSGIAGLIPIALTPLLTKYYTPFDFGQFAVYMSIINIASSFICLKYELTIILPKEDEKALRLISLTIILSLVIGFVLLVLGIIFHSQLNSLFKLDGWVWLPFVIANLIIYNFYQSTFYWCSRKKMFNNISINRIMQNGMIAIFQFCLALLLIKGPFGLLFGRTLGLVISALLLGRILWKAFKANNHPINFETIKSSALEYIEFPKYMVVSQGIAVVYAQIPIWYINNHYNSSSAGHFSLAFQIVTIPSVLIITSMGDTFRQYATDMYNTVGKFDTLLISILKKTILLSIIPFTLFYFFSPYLFNFFYGATWSESGKMASVLSIMILFNIICNPIDKAAIIVKNTRYMLIWHTSRLVFNILILFISNYFQLSIFNYLYLMVLINVLHYLVNTYFMYKFSLGKTTQ